VQRYKIKKNDRKRDEMGMKKPSHYLFGCKKNGKKKKSHGKMVEMELGTDKI